MNGLRTVLLVVGVIGALLGLVWMGQGSGYFPYPKSSFMIDSRPWIWRGLLLLIVGIAVAAFSRRVGR